jgi:MFS family permease
MALRSESKPDDNQPEDPVGGELLAAARAEIADERARAASLESRALTLSAAAAGATALIFGLGADYVGRWRIAFFVFLGLAGLFFLGSAVAAWSVARLRSYEQPQLEEYRRLIDEGWDRGLDELRLYIADGTMTALENARKKNDEKAGLFEKALAFLLVGVVAVGIDLGFVVLDGVLG